MSIAVPTYRMSEDELLASIVELCTHYNIYVYHTHDSRRSAKGFPDLTLIGARVLFREIKTEHGRTRPEQTIVLARLEAAGADADIWRPADWTSGRIAFELKDIKPSATPPYTRTPPSLIPRRNHGGRAL